MIDRELSELRRDYVVGGLSETELAEDPVTMFRTWMHDALRAGIHEPNAMVLSTAAPDGRVASRLVLLKGLDERGFVFFTNYDSEKGVDLGRNPACSLLFPWHVLERQVRIEGRATRLADEENDLYFATRPRASQVGAWASPQSKVVADRAELDRRYDEAAARFGEGEIPRPAYWGGYCVTPESVEFWQGRRNRMHDRIRYRRAGEGWRTDRLAP